MTRHDPSSLRYAGRGPPDAVLHQINPERTTAMRFFIFMPLIPGLILWAFCSLVNHAREQAAAKQLLAMLESKRLEGDVAFNQHFGEPPQDIKRNEQLAEKIKDAYAQDQDSRYGKLWQHL